MKNKLLIVLLTCSLVILHRSFAQEVYHVGGNNSIYIINKASAPAVMAGPYVVEGMAAGQQLVGIVARPDDGRLFALGYDAAAQAAQLYRIMQNGNSYIANSAGRAITPVDLGLAEGLYFNFVSDADNQLKAVGTNGNTYVFNTRTGALFSRSTVNIPQATDGHEATTLALPAPGMAGRVLELFPNPVLNDTYITLSNQPASTVYVDIVDMNGVVERSLWFRPGSYSLDVDMSRLPQGMYSMRVYGKDVALQNITVVKQ